jgi:hypothetical protein
VNYTITFTAVWLYVLAATVLDIGQCPLLLLLTQKLDPVLTI